MPNWLKEYLQNLDLQKSNELWEWAQAQNEIATVWEIIQILEDAKEKTK